MGRGGRDIGEGGLEAGPQLRGELLPPPPAFDPEERAEVAQLSLWIKPAGEDSVCVEIEGYGYDGALRFDYDLCVDDDATGQLGRELLTRLIGREVVARVAAELGVPYDRR